ncbi:hypothetical protein HT031_004629 [Scenedesmus sp. PABB004]|nr:hypothetical protein HT031_004629 [Scenedesmus sp. PABB004]
MPARPTRPGGGATCVRAWAQRELQGAKDADACAGIGADERVAEAQRELQSAKDELAAAHARAEADGSVIASLRADLASARDFAKACQATRENLWADACAGIGADERVAEAQRELQSAKDELAAAHARAEADGSAIASLRADLASARDFAKACQATRENLWADACAGIGADERVAEAQRELQSAKDARAAASADLADVKCQLAAELQLRTSTSKKTRAASRRRGAHKAPKRRRRPAALGRRCPARARRCAATPTSAARRSRAVAEGRCSRSGVLMVQPSVAVRRAWIVWALCSRLPAPVRKCASAFLAAREI